MEDIVYLSVRFTCVAFLLYKVWEMKGRVRKMCDLLYGNVASRKQKAGKETAPYAPSEEIDVADVMGSTRFVHLDENAGKSVAPYMSLPLESDFIGEEKEMEGEDVACNLPLEEMKLLKEEQEGLDGDVPVVETFTQAVTHADLENLGDVLFRIGNADRDEEKSQRAACTLHAIRETEIYAAIEAQVENREYLTELMDRYIDGEGNPLPHKFSRKKEPFVKDWRSFL